MHSFLIAACFVLILLAPCLVAQSDGALWTKTPRAPKQKATPRKPVKRPRVAEQVLRDELEDPGSFAVKQRRAVLLKCARVSQLKQMHLSADGALTASGKSGAA